MRRQLLELRLAVRGLEPAIWRTVLVQDTLRLPRLHRIIVLLFGWSGRRGHQFQAGGRRYGRPIRDKRFPFIHNDQSKVPVRSLLAKAGDEMLYVYDFACEWTVEVRLESVRLPDLFGEYPLCTGGARNGPPEEIAGAQAYAELLRRGRRAYRGFDPEYFNIELANALLAPLR